MPEHDIIVVGASAGGLEALQELAGSLPPDLPASVFVTIHVHPRSKSLLPALLSKAGPLPALHPEDGAPIEKGRIYVAPPNYHMAVENGHIHLGLGPKEQHERPCINVMFRTAAAAYGPRVAGVVLTGQLDDGAAGLWEIKRHGGIAVVQHPEEAPFPSMPLSALREIEVDYTLPVAQIGPLLDRLARQSTPARTGSQERGNDMESKLVDLTCPDCRGNIWAVPRGETVEYRCRVGHSFSPKSMLSEHFTAQEKAIWAAVVALEEGASLCIKLADSMNPELRGSLLEEAKTCKANADAVRSTLQTRKIFDVA
jgi:two-component system, chemotaxis family, protein-glutamate methylesterase/glutaminase